MLRIIAIANQKGGVGKTTTAVNLSAALAEDKHSVLLIDCDPQGNATSGVGVDKNALEKSVYNVLINDLPIDNAICRTDYGLDLLPANINLAGAEIELVNALSRETKLKRALANMGDSYEFIIIDCPPSLGLLTLNALTAAKSVLIPIQCEFYALEGVSQLSNTIHLVSNALNPDLDIEGILLTMHDTRTNLSEQVVNEVRQNFDKKVYNTMIPRTVRLSEAPSYGMPISVYDKRSKGAQSYRDLAKEVVADGN